MPGSSVTFAYQQGHAAGLTPNVSQHNPYRIDTRRFDYDQWNAGYRAGRRALESKLQDAPASFASSTTFAYQQGHAAGLTPNVSQHNPYRIDTRRFDYDQWNAGYRAGRRALESKLQDAPASFASSTTDDYLVDSALGMVAIEAATDVFSSVADSTPDTSSDSFSGGGGDSGGGGADGSW